MTAVAPLICAGCGQTPPSPRKHCPSPSCPWLICGAQLPVNVSASAMWPVCQHRISLIPLPPVKPKADP